MTQETWLVVVAGAGFLLLGIAASPLAWVAVLHRRERYSRETARALLDLNDQIRSLGARLERCEASLLVSRDAGATEGPLAPEPVVFRRTVPPGRSRPARPIGSGPDEL